jgi:hypothetical protein
MAGRAVSPAELGGDSESPSGRASPPTWVFGYGSLVHTPGFAFAEKVVGYLHGWKRVWWQVRLGDSVGLAVDKEPFCSLPASPARIRACAGVY